MSYSNVRRKILDPRVQSLQKALIRHKLKWLDQVLSLPHNDCFFEAGSIWKMVSGGHKSMKISTRRAARTHVVTPPEWGPPHSFNRQQLNIAAGGVLAFEFFIL